MIRKVGEPVTTNFTLTIRQTGTQLTGTIFTEATETAPANSCEFTGSISGTTIDLETNIDSCTFNVLSLPPVPGCGPDPWEIKETSSKVTGTVSGSTIVGVVNATGDYRNAGNVYEIRIAQQFEARR